MFTNNPTIDLSRMTRALMVAIRSSMIVFLIFALDGLIDLGSSPYLISLFGVVGVLLATRLSQTKLLSRGMLLGLGISWAVYAIIVQILLTIAQSGNFKIFLVIQHINLGLLALSIGMFSTWAFFRWKHFVTLEVFAICAGCIYLLSPHRNYHLDSPQFINSFAWQLGVEPQSMLLICAGILISILMILLAFADAREQKLQIHEEPNRLKTNRFLKFVAMAIIFFIVYGLGRAIYSRYDIQKGLTTNGVGESTEEGTSPLGFHSALGSTNHPAALVRLEGDYSSNPYSPMLYLREGALSELNGNELVIASKKFDTDVNNTTPSQLFSGTKDPALESRAEVVHSVYLLSDQKNAFAIDYPVSIKQLKNPDPNRFKFSYRAYSLAPSFNLDDITYEMVGDSRWNQEVENHYLVPHTDIRYRDLALKITQDIPAPVEKARAIVNYLSKNSIYTLTPKHEVKPGSDPVVPYLFGDMRGYCVHFAHATVYMLRALGIPARIATGFLTDLSQAKDGHILLRMSDRHAWAEVYVDRYGWIPFDTQPEQVENAADTNVDLSLLEELMGKLDPGEEILPKDTSSDELEPINSKDIYLPTSQDFAFFVLFILLLYIGYKIYLHYSWILPGSSRTKLYRLYRAVFTTLSEIGFARNSGETLTEFRARLLTLLDTDPLAIVEVINRTKYRSPSIPVSQDDFRVYRHRSISSLRVLPLRKRILGFFNPLPLLGGRL